MENVFLTQLSVPEIRGIIREELRSVILEEKGAQPRNIEETNFQNIHEISKMIDLAVPTIYGLVHRRKIPHIKRGKKLLFEKKLIMEWLANYRQCSAEQTRQRSEAIINKQ